MGKGCERVEGGVGRVTNRVSSMEHLQGSHFLSCLYLLTSVRIQLFKRIQCPPTDIVNSKK